ncbi:MAG: 2-oxo acid dehydrogenase subunit E2, partial [Rhodococcus fascians]
MAATNGQGPGFGANSWLVEEMYEQFVHDPNSVSDSWQEFFADYRAQTPALAAAAAASPRIREIAADHGSAPPATPTVQPPPPLPAPAADDAAAGQPEPEPGKPIRGAGAAIAANMERSLEVPTATSFRNVPAKLLEVNRKVINGFRERTGLTKVSFTHLIGYAIVRAIADEVPAMKNTFLEGADGKPRLIVNEHVNMGLAVDVSKADGSRTLVVPVVRKADTLDFAAFLTAYEEIIRKVKSNKLAVEDFQGA